MEVEENVFRFLDKNEVKKIIDLIEKVEDDDIRSRLYLVSLGYKSFEIQNFTLEEAINMIGDNNIPEVIKKSIEKSYLKRTKKIQEEQLDSEDNIYLFVRNNNVKIHDEVLLRDWRRFLRKNNLGNINIQIFRQSINNLNLIEKYYNSVEKSFDFYDK